MRNPALASVHRRMSAPEYRALIRRLRARFKWLHLADAAELADGALWGTDTEESIVAYLETYPMERA